MLKALVCILALAASTHAMTGKDVPYFIKGLVRGTFEQDIPSLLTCVDQAEGVAHDIEAIVRALEKPDAEHIIDAISKIGGLIQKIQPIISDCEGIPEETKATLKKLEELFQNIQTVAAKVGMALLFRSKDIFNDITKTIADFGGSRFEDAGYDIGDLIKIIFLQRRQAKNMTALDTAIFIEGLAIGMLHDESITVEKCVKDAEDISAVVEKIFEELQNLDNTLLQRIMAAYNIMGESFEIIPYLVEDCGEAGLAIKKLLSTVADEFKHPIDLIVTATKNVFWHGKAIGGDIWRGVIDFNDEHYLDAGKDLGDIIYQLILSRFI